MESVEDIEKERRLKLEKQWQEYKEQVESVDKKKPTPATGPMAGRTVEPLVSGTQKLSSDQRSEMGKKGDTTEDHHAHIAAKIETSLTKKILGKPKH